MPANLRVLVRAPSDLSQILRDIADQVDRGEITDFVGAYCMNGAYDFLYGASLHSSIVLAAMLQHTCIDRMRR
jgi:hypothetical protein